MAKPAAVLLSLGIALLPPALADGVHLESLGPGVTVEALVRSDRSWNGARLPPLSTAQPEVNVVRMTVPPGVKLNLHQHPVIHAGVLLQGRLRLEAEQGASQLLEPGQAVIEVVNRAHRSVSLGPDPAVLIIVFAGPKGTTITLPATP